MHSLRVSVIIPAYNEEKYIGSCLDAILKNGAGYIDEIIVVDNASKDKTKQIAESYAGVKVLSETQKGPTFARQRGYLEATGNLLAFVDSDTRMPANRAKHVKERFSQDQKLGIVTGPYTYYDLPWYGRWISWLYYNPLLVKTISLIFGGICTGGNFAIRKSVLDQMHGFNTKIVFYGDEADITRRAKVFGTIEYHLRLKMPTSQRRYQHLGIIKTGWFYLINYFNMIFRHKPATIEYEDFR